MYSDGSCCCLLAETSYYLHEERFLIIISSCPCTLSAAILHAPRSISRRSHLLHALIMCINNVHDINTSYLLRVYNMNGSTVSASLLRYNMVYQSGPGPITIIFAAIRKPFFITSNLPRVPLSYIYKQVLYYISYRCIEFLTINIRMDTTRLDTAVWFAPECSAIKIYNNYNIMILCDDKRFVIYNRLKQY